jgi:hypothetical protein
MFDGRDCRQSAVLHVASNRSSFRRYRAVSVLLWLKRSFPHFPGPFLMLVPKCVSRAAFSSTRLRSIDGLPCLQRLGKVGLVVRTRERASMSGRTSFCTSFVNSHSFSRQFLSVVQKLNTKIRRGSLCGVSSMAPANPICLSRILNTARSMESRNRELRPALAMNSATRALSVWPPKEFRGPSSQTLHSDSARLGLATWATLVSICGSTPERLLLPPPGSAHPGCLATRGRDAPGGRVTLNEKCGLGPPSAPALQPTQGIVQFERNSFHGGSQLLGIDQIAGNLGRKSPFKPLHSTWRTGYGPDEAECGMTVTVTGCSS